MLNPSFHESFTGGTNKTAIILNPAESMYGHYQCQRIINTLLNLDYSIEYLANQAVDVTYIKNNLSADVIYMNTHAGYFDVDGDHQADAVVIATGELWTNETEQKYAYDYQNHLIVKGRVRRVHPCVHQRVLYAKAVPWFSGVHGDLLCVV
jgi:hypothetical protein